MLCVLAYSLSISLPFCLSRSFFISWFMRFSFVLFFLNVSGCIFFHRFLLIRHILFAIQKNSLKLCLHSHPTSLLLLFLFHCYCFVKVIFRSFSFVGSNSMCALNVHKHKTLHIKVWLKKYYVLIMRGPLNLANEWFNL